MDSSSLQTLNAKASNLCNKAMKMIRQGKQNNDQNLIKKAEKIYAEYIELTKDIDMIEDTI